MKRYLAGFCVIALAACGPQQKAETNMTKIETTERTSPHQPAERIWLEEVLGEKALQWVRSKNEHTLQKLEADPRFANLQSDALGIVNATDKIAYGNHRDGFVYNFWQDGDHVHGIWRRAPLGEYILGEPKWDILLDVDALSKAEGENWVYKGADCLGPQYTKCIITLSPGGKDASVRREFDINSKSFVEGGFAIPESKGGTTWVDENTLLVATNWGAGSMTSSGYPFVLKKWTRGTELSDATEVIRGNETDVAIHSFKQEMDGKTYMFAAEYDTFYETKWWALPMDGKAPMQLPVPAKTNFQAVFAGQAIFSLDEKWDHNGKTWPQGAMVSFDLHSFLQTGDIETVTEVLIPGPRASVDSVDAIRSSLIVGMLDNVSSKIFSYTFDGRKWHAVRLDLPENGNIGISSSNMHSDIILASMQSFLRPNSLMMIDVPKNSAKVIRSLPDRFDSSNLLVEQKQAVSKDGTKVPYFVVRHKNTKMDGKNPTLLYGYGGFQISLQPTYSGTLGKLWLENGGIYVLANIRGGGEFGPKWHQAGLKTKRQVIYDDFIAIAEDIIASKLTDTKHLGIRGGSNGGLLMGVMYTQRPDLWNAVICQVPLLDMMRFHKLLAGASWMGEYGNPDDAKEGAFLHSISPYHNVHADQKYPDIFFMTSTKDDRVHPAHARKMANLLEELDKPFLYYENIDGGHSAAANLSETARREALAYTFLMEKLVD